MKRILQVMLIVMVSAIRGNEIEPMEPKTRFISYVLNGLVSLIENIYAVQSIDSQTYQVRTGSNLCDQEQAFQSRRLVVTKAAVEKLLQQPLEQEDVPRIAFCFSGGGMRSLVLTLGFLEGAQEIGLLDAATYAAGLSGSTWALAKWIESGLSVDACRAGLGALTKRGLQPIIHKDHVHALSQSATKWMLVNQPLSTVNIYGALLANMLFANHDSSRFSLSLSQTHQLCATGAYPLPIYTAVAPINNDYQWFEVTPFEIGSSFFKAYVPVHSYGMKFKHGQSAGKAIPLSLGYFLGVFGSAFHVTLNDLLRISGRELMHDIAHLPSPLQTVVDDVLYSLLQGPLKNVRALPSRLRNITYKLDGQPLANEKWLTLVDAGIACNLPFPVLLDKRRSVDIIVVYDASADNDVHDTLKCTQDYALSHNLKFPAIDYQQLLTDQSMYVFKDPIDHHCPVVIYFPMKKNDSYDRLFDPIALSRHGFCSTFNFVYSQRQINKLAGLARTTVVQHAQTITSVIENWVSDQRAARS